MTSREKLVRQLNSPLNSRKTSAFLRSSYQLDIVRQNRNRVILHYVVLGSFVLIAALIVLMTININI